jgi:hypothetical protein
MHRHHEVFISGSSRAAAASIGRDNLRGPTKSIAKTSTGGRSLMPFRLPAYEPNQIPQGGRREQRDGGVFVRRLFARVWHRQVGPTPGHRPHHTIVESYQHPWDVVAPEHAADATPLAAGRALFRDDRQRRTAECNIRCSLSLG